MESTCVTHIALSIFHIGHLDNGEFISFAPIPRRIAHDPELLINLNMWEEKNACTSLRSDTFSRFSMKGESHLKCYLKKIVFSLSGFML